MKTHLIPHEIDPVSETFWQALHQRRLSLQTCDGCQFVRFPAAERCPQCWSTAAEWKAYPAIGTVWSHTTYHRPLHPGLADAVPYTVALVQLDAGPAIPGRILGAQRPRIGAAVEGVFTVVGESVTMLEWTLVPGLSEVASV
jgi:uncharacterized OB-fold protein